MPDRATVHAFWLSVAAVVGCTLLSVVPAIAFQLLTGIRFTPASQEPAMRSALAMSPVALIGAMALAGVMEELIFRVIPLGGFLFLSRSLAMSKRATTAWLVALVVASSALFGYLHNGLESLFHQGVTGLVLALAFLVIERRRDWAFASLVVMTAHAQYDLIAVALAKAVVSSA